MTDIIKGIPKWKDNNNVLILFTDGTRMGFTSEDIPHFKKCLEEPVVHFGESITIFPRNIIAIFYREKE